MKRRVRGTFTIEAAVIVPLILVIFIVIMNLLFYYHDKNLVLAAAHETISTWAKEEEMTKEEIERHFQKNIKEQTLFFYNVNAIIEIDESELNMDCVAAQNGMKLQVQMNMCRTNPEAGIRKLRIIEKIQGDIE